MRERVTALAGERAREVTVGTFHAFCAQVAARARPRARPRRASFTICDASDQLAAVKSAMRELRVHETTMHPSAVLARISLAKNRMETPEAFLAERRTGGRDQLVGSVWQRYREFLARTRVARLRRPAARDGAPAARARAGARALPRGATATCWSTSTRTRTTRSTRSCGSIGGEHRNVCVVGDDDQSIYGWRGADIRKILGFHARLPRRQGACGSQTNYRSTRPILDAANAVIRHNAVAPREGAASRRAAPASPCASCALKDETAEAQLVVERDAPAAPPRGGEARGLRDPLPHAGAVPAVRGGAARERPALRRGGRHVVLRPQGGARRRRVPEARGQPATTRRRCCASSTRRRAAWARPASTACSPSPPSRGSRRARPSSARARSRASRRRPSEGYRALRAVARRLRPRRRRTAPGLPARALPAGASATATR